ncbi:MAG: glycosyltransferase family 4 protein [Deltaproteobacteria bacterium]|nr:glycosyltransferase family 4 protein [Deltaproteobacteria bacterium]
MKPVNILTIGHSYVVRANRAVIRQIARQPGIEITVASPRFFKGDLRPVHFESEVSAPYESVELPAHLTHIPPIFFYRGIAALMTATPWDIIHLWEEPYTVAGYQIARAATRSHIPYFFVTFQNIEKSYPLPFSYFEKFCVSHSSGWVAAGRTVQQTLLSRGYSQQGSDLIPAGVDDDLFQPQPHLKEQMKKALGFEGLVVGFAGRLTEEKGIDILASAMQKIPGHWNLLLLGSGHCEKKLRTWAQSLNLGARFRIVLATHDEVPRYLNIMDVLTVPSQTTPRWKEQFGRVIAEAFACGVPVIGSDSGEIPYVIADAGLIIKEHDTTAWEQAIQAVLNSPEKRNEMRKAGLLRFNKCFSASSVAAKYIAFYERLLSQ